MEKYSSVKKVEKFKVARQKNRLAAREEEQ